MTVLVLGATALVGAWFAARWLGRGKPCPVLVAALFDNHVVEKLSGTGLIIERADVSEGMRVLDAGCGPGRLTIPLARRVGPSGEVVAFDLQQEMLDRVNANAARVGLTNIRTLLGALESDAALRALEQAFDRVLLVTVLGEIADQASALRALHRTLKPGGILSISEMIIDPDYVPHRRLERLAERAGFRIEGRWGSPLLSTTNLVKNDGSH